MKAIASGALIALLGISCAAAESMTRDPLAPLDAPPRPAPAPVKPVTETLWGKQVTDNYRYMEALDPSDHRMDEGARCVYAFDSGCDPAPRRA